MHERVAGNGHTQKVRSEPEATQQSRGSTHPKKYAEGAGALGAAPGGLWGAGGGGFAFLLKGNNVRSNQPEVLVHPGSTTSIDFSPPQKKSPAEKDSLKPTGNTNQMGMTQN